MQNLQTGAAGAQLACSVLLVVGCSRFSDLSSFQFLARFVEGTARRVKAGLRAAKVARLSPRLRFGVEPVALAELADGARKRFVLLQLASVFLQLIESVRYVAKQFGGQRGKGFGQCV